MNPLTYVADGLRNLVSKIGHPSKDKAANWVYDLCPLTPEECLSMYMSDWLSRKIVDIIAQDATREWRTWQAKDKQAQSLYEAEKALYVRNKVMRAMILDRLFGGAAIFIGTGDRNPEEPLDVTKIKKGGIKYLRVFSRWDLRAGNLVQDITSEAFGLPEWYELVRTVDGKYQGIKIHRSRFAFFISNPLPSDWMIFRSTPEYNSGGVVGAAFDGQIGWGQSIFEPIRKALINAGAVAENTASLTEEAKVDVVQIPNLMSYMANDETQSKLVSRFGLANFLKSNNSMLLLGGDEKFDRKQISFAQLPELMNAHLQIASGAADIPIVRLLGQSPSGLNSSGDTDIRMHYDKIRQHQNNDLTNGALLQLDEALVHHTFGDHPDGVVYEWDALWQMNETEIADIAQKKIGAFVQLNNTGLFAPEELRPAVADVLVSDGILPSLDQHLLDQSQVDNMMEEQQNLLAQQQQQQQNPQLENKSGNTNGSGNNGANAKDSILHDFFDAFGIVRDDANGHIKDDLGINKYKESMHPRGPGGRWTNKPGMGKKSKSLPQFHMKKVEEAQRIAGANRSETSNRSESSNKENPDGSGTVRQSAKQGNGEQPAAYERASGGDVRGTRGSIKSIQSFTRNGISFHELDSAKNASDFASMIKDAKTKNKFGSSVYVYDDADYKNMRLFTTDDGKSGFALKGDDIVSAFRHPESKTQNVVPNMLDLATQQGGKRLDAFDTILPTLYAQSGFKAVARVKWNDDYAPEGWDANLYKAFNNGKPDVVFMVHDPSGASQGYKAGDGKIIDSYEKGATEQDAALKGQGSQGGKAQGEAQAAKGGDPKASGTETAASGQAGSQSPETAEVSGTSAGELLQQYSQQNVTAQSIVDKYPGAKEKITQVQKDIESLIPTDAPQDKGGFKLPNGQYTPERMRLHWEISNKILSPETIKAATPENGQKPIMTLLGGRGGSGKSWFTQKGPVAADKAIYINSDDIQPMLPGYEKWKAAAYHEEASDIANFVKLRAKQMGLSVVLDATMRSPKFSSEISAFRNAGYRIEGYYMFAAPHVAADRAVGRFMKGDRYVPPAYSLSSTTNEATFDGVKDSLDRWAVYDNMGTSPRLHAKGGDWQNDKGK